MEKKCMKTKGNNVGSCSFLPMTSQNTDLGWENLKNIYLKSVKSKYSFQQVFDPLPSRWSIIIKSHRRMLCPNTQAVINGYETGWGPRPFFPKRAEIWIGDGKNVYM